MKQQNKCEECRKNISHWNKSGLCSYHYLKMYQKSPHGKEKRRLWRLKNRKQLNKGNLAYYYKHQERLKRKGREYYIRDREKRKKAWRDYYSKNKEEVKKKGRENYAKNREKIIKRNRAYRSKRKLKNVTPEEWGERFINE